VSGSIQESLAFRRTGHIAFAVVAFATPFLSAFLADFPPVSLGLAFLVVYVLPGYALWRLGANEQSWGLEALAGAFGLGFVLCTLFSIILVEFNVPLDTLLWVWSLGTSGLLLICAMRSTLPRLTLFTKNDVILAVPGLLLLTLIVTFLYRIGGTYGSLGGEEGYHLIYIRRLFSLSDPNSYNLFYMKGVSSTYIYLPYHLSIALMAKLSGLDPLAAYTKFRPFAAAMVLVTMSALVARIAADRRAGWMALILISGFILTNHLGLVSGYFAQFIPISHHSDIMLGLGLAMGCFFLWRAASSDQHFGFDFWTAAFVCGAILVSHAREGIQLFLYALVMGLGMLIFRERRRALSLLGIVLFLLITGLLYKHFQDLRAVHLQGWEEAEKSWAFVQFGSYLSRLWHGELGAMFGPRIDVTTNYMPGFDLFFKPFYSMAAIATLIMLAVRKDILSACIVVIVFGIMISTLFPYSALLMVILSYSQVLYSPIRFIMHWELAFFCVAVFMLVNTGNRWVLAPSTPILQKQSVVLRGGIIVGLFGLTSYALPSIIERFSVLTRSYPWLLILTGCAVGGFFIVKLYRSQRAGQVLPVNAVHSAGPGNAEGRGWVVAVLVLALAIPAYRWQVAPTLWTQYENAETRPTGLNVNEWIDKTGLLDIPKPARDILSKQALQNTVVAYDPRYVFNLPVLYNVYIPSLAFYLSSERTFFDNYYKRRNRKPPLNQYIGSMYKYVDTYISDLMLRFPLYNWLDPLEVTLDDILGEGIEYILVNQDFLSLWLTYRDYFSEVFVSEYEGDDFAVFRVVREKLPGALARIKAQRAQWISKDIEQGYLVRAAETLRFASSEIPDADMRRLSAEVIEHLPSNIVAGLSKSGDSPAQLLKFLVDTVFMPAQKHYIVHLQLDRLRTAGQENRKESLVFPIFVPKSKDYELVVFAQTSLEGSFFPASEGKPLALLQELSIKGEYRYRYKIDKRGFQQLTINITNDEAWASIKDLQLVEDIDWGAISVHLPKIKK
jgi:hypothetical protein